MNKLAANAAQWYTSPMRKMIHYFLLLSLFLPLFARADTLLSTKDGYRLAATDPEGRALLVQQITEEADGLVTNASAQVTLFSREDGPLWETVIGGNGDDELRQALFTGSHWVAVGASASSDLNNGWHQGWYDDKEGKTDGWFVRLTADGEVVSTKCLGGSDWDRLRGICSAWDGGTIAVGETHSRDGDVTGWHDSGPLFERPDGWVLHLDEDGNILWQATLGGSGDDTLRAVIPVEGGYLAIGETNSTDGDVPPGTRYEADAWVVLLDTEGNCLRSLCYGGEGADSLWAIAKGPTVVLAGGHSSSETDWKFRENAWAVALTEQGDLLWDRRFGYENYDYIRAVTWQNGFFAMAGFTQRGTEQETDPWIVRIGPDSEGLATIAGGFGEE